MYYKVLFSLAFLILQISACISQPVKDEHNNHFSAQLDSLVPPLLKEHSVPGVSLAVIRGGKVDWVKGYGYADISSNEKVNAETVFNIGSVSKTITAWGIMKLSEENRIGLDSPILKYITRWTFPPSPFDAGKVTVRMVLSHTAGLNVRGYHGIFRSDFKAPTLLESLSGYEGSDGGLSVVREPGTEMVYSSGGYTLLQLLIEEVTGQSFEEFMEKTVFAPLNMTSTGYTWKGKLQSRVAVPYSAEKKSYPYYPGPEFGSGGCYSTASDLAKFVAQVYISTPSSVLRRSSIDEMIKPAEHTNNQYGLGYKMFPVSDSVFLVAHDGANEGWRAQFMIEPKSGDGLVALINSDKGGKIMAPIICEVFSLSKINMSALCNSLKR